MNTTQLKLSRNAERIKRNLLRNNYKSEKEINYYGKKELANVTNSQRLNAVKKEMDCETEFDSYLKKIGSYEFTAGRNFTYTIFNNSDYETTDVYYLFVDFWEEKLLFLNGCTVVDLDGNAYKTQRYNSLRGTSLAVNLTLKPHSSKILKIIPQSIFSNDSAKRNFKTFFEFLKRIFVKNKYFIGEIYNIELNNGSVNSIIYKNSEILADSIKPVFYENGKETDIKSASLKLEASGKLFKKYNVCYKFFSATIKSCNIKFIFFNSVNKFDINVELIKDVNESSDSMDLVIPFKNLVLKNENLEPSDKIENIEKGVIANCGNTALSIYMFDSNKAEKIGNTLHLNLYKENNEKGFSDAVIEEFRFSVSLGMEKDSVRKLEYLDTIPLAVRGEENEL